VACANFAQTLKHNFFKTNFMKHLTFALFLFCSVAVSAQSEPYSLSLIATGGGAVRATSAGTSNGPVFSAGILYRNYEDALSFGLQMGYTSWQAKGEPAQRRHYFRGEMGKPLSNFITFNLGVSAFASRDAGNVQLSVGPNVYFHMFDKKSSSLLVVLGGGFGGVNYVGAQIGYAFTIKGK
jgi:hypothetical protein